MARVLMGWELGANAGHARRLEALARTFGAAGHTVSLVVQRPASLDPNAIAGRTVAQAPQWPAPRRTTGLPGRFGDILYNLGWQDAQSLSALLRSWDSLLKEHRPDIVIADFAPALTLVARGRVPRLVTGTGYTVPPSGGACFPSWTGGGAAQIDEAVLLRLTNAALRSLGLARLESLPQLLVAEANCPAVFAELDPYADSRVGPALSPFVPHDLPPRDSPRGKGVFAYLSGPETRAGLALLVALARRGPLTAVLPRYTPAARAEIAAAGGRVLADPHTWAGIRAHHGLVLCSGGMGMVSAALLTGTALAVLPSGIEQYLTAKALEMHRLSFPVEGRAGDVATQLHDAADRPCDAGFDAQWTDPAEEILRQAEMLALR